MLKYSPGKYPNQSFYVEVNGTILFFTLRTFHDIIYASVSINGENVVAGARCVNNASILPKSISRTIGGNFKFVDINGDYPSFENFDGVTCSLVFYEEEG